MFVATARSIAMRDMTRTLIAAERDRRRNESFPATLNELVPDLLEPLPIDPFTGRRLSYRADQTKCLVYSVGKTQQDDGGDPSDYLEPDVILSMDRACAGANEEIR